MWCICTYVLVFSLIPFRITHE